MSHRIERVGLGLLFLACLLLAAAAPAQEGTYVEGVVGRPFTFRSLGQALGGGLGGGLTIVGDEDQTLVLDVGAVTGGPTTEAVCPFVGHSQLGGPHPGVGLQRFRVHADFSQATGVILAVFFNAWPNSEEWVSDWHATAYTGVDETGALVFTPPPYSGGQCFPVHGFAYKLVFTLADQGATGTVTVADFAVDWGEYVAPPDDEEDDGGKGGDHDRARKQGPGVAYMGGNDSDLGSGGEATGSGSSQGSERSAGAGSPIDDDGASQTGEGEARVDANAPVGADPVTSAGDTVTGYLVRASDLIAGVSEGVGGSRSAGAPAPGDSQSGASRLGLMWLALALLFLAPLVAAELEQRLARRRLRALVESTPDEPVPGIAPPG